MLHKFKQRYTRKEVLEEIKTMELSEDTKREQGHLNLKLSQICQFVSGYEVTIFTVKPM